MGCTYARLTAKNIHQYFNNYLNKKDDNNYRIKQSAVQQAKNS